MTNPATPPASPTPGSPPPAGGMPKWLIILIVVLLVMMLGCCGGFAACHFMCQAAGNAITAQTAQIRAEAERQLQEAQKQAAQQQAAQQQAAGGGAPGVETPAAPDAGAAGNAAPAGNTAPKDPSIAAGLGSGKMPVNFPSDVPIVSGLSPTGVSAADKVKNSGMVMMSGSISREDASAYYELELPKKGWTLEANQDIGQETIMKFTKDTRTMTVQIITDNDKSKSVVNFIYETKQ